MYVFVCRPTADRWVGIGCVRGRDMAVVFKETELPKQYQQMLVCLFSEGSMFGPWGSKT